MAEVLPAAERTRLNRERALAHVPGCETGAPPLELRALHGGTANHSWLVRTRQGRFVLRVHSASAVLGADHAREALLQSCAAAAGLAPALIAVDPRGRFMVSEFVRGARWNATDMNEPRPLARLARRLAMLHSLTAPRARSFDPAALVRAHVRHLGGTRDREVARLQPFLARVAPTLRMLAASNRARCMVHGDLHHSNLLGRGRPRLVDWEYASVSDPIFDLGCLTAYYPAAARYSELLLDESGLAQSASVEDLRAASWLYCLLSYLWYRRLREFGPVGRTVRAHERTLLARLI